MAFHPSNKTDSGGAKELSVPEIWIVARIHYQKGRVYPEKYVPGQARSVIQILSIKAWSSKPIPRLDGIDKRQVRIQDTPPTPSNVVDGIDAAITEVRVPLLSHEVLVPDIRARGVDWDHVYSLYILVVGAEVGCVVDFIFE